MSKDRSPSRSASRSVSRSASRSPSRSHSRTPTPVAKKGSPRESRSASRSSSSSSSLSASSSGSSRTKSSRSHSKSNSRSSRSTSRSPASRARSGSASKSSEIRRRSPTPVTKIHVNKLTRNVTKKHLTEIFKTYGTIKNIDIQTDRFHPQLGRGSAYIEYEKTADAEKAIRYMDGGQIDGQEIIVTRFRQRNINRPHLNRRNIGGVGGGYRNGGWKRYSVTRR